MQAVKTSIPLAQMSKAVTLKLRPSLSAGVGLCGPAPILELSVTEPLTDRTTLSIHHEQGGPISLPENDHH